MSCSCNNKIGKTNSKMKTSQLASSALAALSAGGGIYAGKYIRKQNFFNLDPMLQDGLHIVLGAAIIPMLAKGKSENLKIFGAAIAGEALVSLANTYLPEDFKVSGVDNSGYALAGYDNGPGYSLAGYSMYGSQPKQANRSVPDMVAG
jgi:hypothetical protein